MKILVVFTGGTIGSTVSDGYISTDGNKPYRLLNEYEKYRAARKNCGIREHDVCFDTVKPYTVLSENMDCSYYPQLVKAVTDGISGGYDGIIVTHGSDTVQYTAAVLSYALGLDTVPVMVVCSNYVIEDSRANGIANFAAAVDFIAGGYGGGVFVPYANAGEPCRIHRGTRLMPHVPYSDYLYSCGNGFFGHFEDEKFVPNPDYSEQNTGIRYKIADKCGRESGVLWINPYPGMSYPELSDGIHAILFGSFHSGTLCTASEALRAFADSAKRRNIPIYLTGATDGPDYASCMEFEKLGIHVLPAASPIAVYIKLWLAGCFENAPAVETPAGGDYARV